MDWNMITAISTASMALIILVTAIFAVLQLWEIKRSRKVTAFVSLSQFLQEEATRKARGILIGASGKKFNDWSKEEIEAAEKVCSTYDVAGIMLSKKLIEKDLLMEWRDSLIKSWEVAKPMIIEYRKTRGKDYWDDFENLYRMAKKIKTVYNTDTVNRHHGLDK